MITAKKFFRANEFMYGGDIRLKADTLKLMLIKPGFKYDNTLVVRSQIAAFEIDYNLYYPLGGKSVGTVSLSTNSVGKVQLSIDKVEFSRINALVEGAVIYKDGLTLDGLTDPLLFYIHLGVDGGVLYKNTIFRLTWPLPLMEV